MRFTRTVAARLSIAVAASSAAGCFCSRHDARLNFFEDRPGERVAGGEMVDFDKVRFPVPEGWSGGKFEDGVILTPGGKKPEEAGCWIILRKSEATKLTLHDWVRSVMERDLGGGATLVKKTEGIRRPGGRSMAYIAAEVKRCEKSEFWFYVGVPVERATAMPVIYHADSDRSFNEHLSGPSTLLEMIRMQADSAPTPPAKK